MDRAQIAKMASNHWDYAEGLIRSVSGRVTIESAKYIFISAFIHGFKHGVESENESTIRAENAD